MATPTPLPTLPDLVAHADWSAHPRKRWMAQARLDEGSRYDAMAPQRVDDPRDLFDHLRAQAGPSGAILVGFDFPIGLPQAYAAMAGIREFLDCLPEFGQGEWVDFYEVAALPREIHLRRPFYPDKPWHTSQAHLLDGLKLGDIDQLRRKCELAGPNRRAAAPLFWTLGGQQVGKAAINGWRELLAPAIRKDKLAKAPPSLSIWPFSGPLEGLLLPGRTVVAETYPAEFYTHLGLKLSRRSPGKRSGKRSPDTRRANAPRLLAWAEQNDIRLEPALEAAITNGFGTPQSGEDPFDAVAGLFGMLNVVRGNQPAGDPEQPELQRVEGWILGQR